MQALGPGVEGAPPGSIRQRSHGGHGHDGAIEIGDGIGGGCDRQRAAPGDQTIPPARQGQRHNGQQRQRNQLQRAAQADQQPGEQRSGRHSAEQQGQGADDGGNRQGVVPASQQVDRKEEKGVEPGHPQRAIAIDAPGQPVEGNERERFSSDGHQPEKRRKPQPLIIPGRDQPGDAIDRHGEPGEERRVLGPVVTIGQEAEVLPARPALIEDQIAVVTDVPAGPKKEHRSQPKRDKQGQQEQKITRRVFLALDHVIGLSHCRRQSTQWHWAWASAPTPCGISIRGLFGRVLPSTTLKKKRRGGPKMGKS